MSKRYYSGVIKSSPTTSPGIFDTGTVFVASGSAVSVYGVRSAASYTVIIVPAGTVSADNTSTGPPLVADTVINVEDITLSM